MAIPLAPKCPICGADLPANAPQGLCPKCLLAGVAAPTESGTPEHHHPAPSLESVQAAFPQLEVTALIGQGGMGAVFKARQPKLNRFVALKILPDALSKDPAFAERFAREAQLLARLHHPNIVTVHDFGQANGFFYLLMEYVEGVNLRQAMAAGRFTPAQALAIVPMICESLQYAHEEGVLHRDIKPENILLDTKGRVRLVDFGIAKLAVPGGPADPASAERLSDPALTQTGTALGTPHYMAPEQRLSPGTVDQRADIYSLGVVFYELLTGELPAGGFARPSQKTPLDPRIDDVVLRAMAREREKRFPTAEAVKTAIDTIAAESAMAVPSIAVPAAAEGHPFPQSPVFRKAVLGMLLLLGGLSCYQLSGSQTLFWGLWHRLTSEWWLQNVITLAGLAAVAWLAWKVWDQRLWLTAPFQLWQSWTGGERPQAFLGPGWTVDDWLRLVCLGWIGLLGVECLWMLLSGVSMLAQALTTPSGLMALSLVIPLGVFLSPPGLLLLLLWLLVWREVRRTELCDPAPPPPWLVRAAALFLVFGILTTWPMHSSGAAVAAIDFGPFAGAGALAILSRSRIWRAITIAVLSELLISGGFGLGMFLLMGSRDQLEPPWWERFGPMNAFTIAAIAQALALGCYAGGLAALLLPRASAAFGIPSRDRARPARLAAQA